MTVASTTRRADAVGNGAASVYPFAYRILDDDDLLVSVEDTDGNITELAKTTDYTVSGVGAYAGGSITLVDSGQAWLDADGDLLTDYRITIRRRLTITQTTDLRNRGGFYPEDHETAFDRLTMICLQQQDEIDRSLKFPETDDTSLSATLPAATLRLGKYLAFNAAGEPTASAGTGNDTALRTDLADSSVVGNGDALIAGKRSDTGAVAFTLHAFNQNRALNVKTDFGAVGDGVTDDTAALQAALNVGGAIYIPPGVYKVTSTLTLATNAWIVGAGRFETILRQATNFTLLHLNNVDGFGLARFQIHNSQASADVTSGDGIFLQDSAAGVMDDMYINNTWNGIRIQASPILRANAVDIQYFKNYGWRLEGGLNYDVYVKSSFCDGQLAGVANGVASISLMDHCDEIVFDTCVLNLAQYGLYVTAASSAPGVRPAYCRFAHCSFDSTSVAGALLDRSVDFVFEGCFFSSSGAGCAVGNTDSDGTTFLGCMFANSGTNGVFIAVGATYTKFIGCHVISNSLTTPNEAHGINIVGGVTDFSIIGCTITNGWGFSGQQGYGIVINAGASTRYQIIGNSVSGNGLAGISDGSTGTPDRAVRDNIGFVTRNIGSATIASGTTSKVVNHGLSVTPGGDDISISFLTSSTNDPGNFWVTDVGATQFTVNVRNDPGASGLTFAWVAEAMTP